jgi:hypothetical protein
MYVDASLRHQASATSGGISGRPRHRHWTLIARASFFSYRQAGAGSQAGVGGGGGGRGRGRGRWTGRLFSAVSATPESKQERASWHRRAGRQAGRREEDRERRCVPARQEERQRTRGACVPDS